MSYRDDLDALAARHDALAADVSAKTRERDLVRSLLDEAKQRAKLPVLENIRVAAPCTADWNAMTGDERVRHCGSCNKQVFNLSEMTRAEAEALIVERAGRLCARYYQRSDGTILLADCSIGVAKRRKRRVIAAGAAALLAGVGGWLALRGSTVEHAGGPAVDVATDVDEPAVTSQSTEPVVVPIVEQLKKAGEPVHVTMGDIGIARDLDDRR